MPWASLIGIRIGGLLLLFTPQLMANADSDIPFWVASCHFPCEVRGGADTLPADARRAWMGGMFDFGPENEVMIG